MNATWLKSRKIPAIVAWFDISTFWLSLDSLRTKVSNLIQVVIKAIRFFAILSQINWPNFDFIFSLINEYVTFNGIEIIEFSQVKSKHVIMVERVLP